MALESFNSYFSYLKSIEPLNDAERGRLWTALLIYSSTGTVPELSGNERFIFPTMKWQIDRDREKYDAFCEKQAENGKRGGRPPKPVLNSETQKTQAFSEKPKKAYDKAKDKDKDKAKEKEKEEEKDETSSLPTASISPLPAGSSCGESAETASPPVISLILNDHSDFIVTQEDVDGWTALFPAVDVMQELRSMKAWCNANPKQRKTRAGAARFIGSWLTREQNRGGTRRSPPEGQGGGDQRPCNKSFSEIIQEAKDRDA